MGLLTADEVLVKFLLSQQELADSFVLLEDFLLLRLHVLVLTVNQLNQLLDLTLEEGLLVIVDANTALAIAGLDHGVTHLREENVLVFAVEVLRIRNLHALEVRLVAVSEGVATLSTATTTIEGATHGAVHQLVER